MGRIITRPRVPVAAALLRHDDKPYGSVVADKEHPHSNDLRFWSPWLQGQGGRDINDFDVTRQNEIINWTNGITRNDDGSANFASFTEEIRQRAKAINEPDYLTVLCKVKINKGSLQNKFIISRDKHTYDAPFFSFHIRIQQGSNNRLVTNIGDQTTTGYTIQPTNGFNIYYGVDIWIALTWDGANQTHMIFNADGVLQEQLSEVSGPSGPIYYWPTDLYIGDTYFAKSGFNNQYRGFDNGDKLYDLAFWGHPKTSVELSETIRNRYPSLKAPFDEPFRYAPAVAPAPENPLFFGTNF